MDPLHSHHHGHNFSGSRNEPSNPRDGRARRRSLLPGEDSPSAWRRELEVSPQAGQRRHSSSPERRGRSDENGQSEPTRSGSSRAHKKTSQKHSDGKNGKVLMQIHGLRHSTNLNGREGYTVGKDGDRTLVQLVDIDKIVKVRDEHLFLVSTLKRRGEYRTFEEFSREHPSEEELSAPAFQLTEPRNVSSRHSAAASSEEHVHLELMAQDFYAFMGLPKSCTDIAEMRRAYKELAIRLHPDKRNNSTKAQQEFARLVEAYNTLTDPVRRYDYNKQLEQAAAPAAHRKKEDAEAEKGKRREGEPGEGDRHAAGRHSRERADAHAAFKAPSRRKEGGREHDRKWYDSKAMSQSAQDMFMEESRRRNVERGDRGGQGRESERGERKDGEGGSEREKRDRAGLYAALGAKREDGEEALKRCFRQVETACRPSKNPHFSPAELAIAKPHWKKAKEAYAVLGDPMKRFLYDQGAAVDEINEAVQLHNGGGLPKHRAAPASHQRTRLNSND